MGQPKMRALTMDWLLVIPPDDAVLFFQSPLDVS
jgi:hypothetical protein